MTTILVLPEWTKEAPTECGIYRYREDGKSAMWVEVVQPIQVLRAWTFGNNTLIPVTRCPGEWQGPILIEETQP